MESIMLLMGVGAGLPRVTEILSVWQGTNRALSGYPFHAPTWIVKFHVHFYTYTVILNFSEATCWLNCAFMFSGVEICSFKR